MTLEFSWATNFSLNIQTLITECFTRRSVNLKEFLQKKNQVFLTFLLQMTMSFSPNLSIGFLFCRPKDYKSLISVKELTSSETDIIFETFFCFLHIARK